MMGSTLLPHTQAGVKHAHTPQDLTHNRKGPTKHSGGAQRRRWRMRFEQVDQGGSAAMGSSPISQLPLEVKKHAGQPRGKLEQLVLFKFNRPS